MFAVGKRRVRPAVPLKLEAVRKYRVARRLCLLPPDRLPPRKPLKPVPPYLLGKAEPVPRKPVKRKAWAVQQVSNRLK